MVIFSSATSYHNKYCVVFKKTSVKTASTWTHFGFFITSINAAWNVCQWPQQRFSSDQNHMGGVMTILSSELPLLYNSYRAQRKSIRTRYLICVVSTTIQWCMLTMYMHLWEPRKECFSLRYCSSATSYWQQHSRVWRFLTHHSIQQAILRVERFDTNQVD